MARWTARRRAKNKTFVAAPKFDIVKWFNRRFAKKGVLVGATPKRVRWAVYAAIVLVGGVAAYFIAGTGDDPGGQRAAPRTTTTVAAPVTTTLPLDDPAVCDARAAVTAASLKLEVNMGGESLIETLETISGGLEVMSAASEHPDLVSAAQTMAPVVDETLAVVLASPSEDLAELIESPKFTENPIFTDSAIVESMETFFAYHLNCAST